MFISKGQRVQIRALITQEIATYSLAGVMTKFAAREVEFTGTVRHYRGDHPTSPTSVRIFVQPDDPTLFEGLSGTCTCEKCGVFEVGPLNPNTIVGLLSA